MFLSDWLWRLRGLYCYDTIITTHFNKAIVIIFRISLRSLRNYCPIILCQLANFSASAREMILEMSHVQRSCPSIHFHSQLGTSILTYKRKMIWVQLWKRDPYSLSYLDWNNHIFTIQCLNRYTIFLHWRYILLTSLSKYQTSSTRKDPATYSAAPFQHPGRQHLEQYQRWHPW